MVSALEKIKTFLDLCKQVDEKMRKENVSLKATCQRLGIGTHSIKRWLVEGVIPTNTTVDRLIPRFEKYLKEAPTEKRIGGSPSLYHVEKKINLLTENIEDLRGSFDQAFVLLKELHEAFALDEVDVSGIRDDLDVDQAESSEEKADSVVLSSQVEDKPAPSNGGMFL